MDMDADHPAPGAQPSLAREGGVRGLLRMTGRHRGGVSLYAGDPPPMTAVR